MEHGSPSLPQDLAACHERIRSLEAQVAHLEQVCDEQQGSIGCLQEQLAQAAEQIKLLRKRLFGSRRERYIASPEQLLLFAPETMDESEAEQEDPESAAESGRGRRKRRRKRKRFEFSQFLPRHREDHPLPEDQLPCSCCGEPRVVIQEHLTKQIELKPPEAYVAEHMRYTYACPHCRRGDQVVTTEKPPQAIEKGLFGPGALAWIIDAKFVRHLPLYRQQELLRGMTRMWFDRSLLCGSVLRVADLFEPLKRLIAQQILASFAVNADETRARVLRPGTGKAHEAYLWAYAGDAEHPYVWFDFRLDHSRASPQEFLAEYEGGLQTDGLSAYVKVIKDSDGRIVDLGCWAHGRRGFDEACTVTNHVLAHEALAWTGQLYDLEDRARQWSPAERYRLRQAEAVPILKRLHERMTEVLPALRPKSKLADATRYVLNRWPAMLRYTDDGRYAMDNNLIERMLRAVAVGRKNYLFFGSDRGGHGAATIYTIVQSARRNLVDTLPYLTDLLKRLPALSTDDVAGLQELLPDRWVRAHPEHRLEDREEEFRLANERRRRRRAHRRLAG